MKLPEFAVVLSFAVLIPASSCLADSVFGVAYSGAGQSCSTLNGGSQSCLPVADGFSGNFTLTAKQLKNNGSYAVSFFTGSGEDDFEGLWIKFPFPSGPHHSLELYATGTAVVSNGAMDDLIVSGIGYAAGTGDGFNSLESYNFSAQGGTYTASHTWEELGGVNDLVADIETSGVYAITAVPEPSFAFLSALAIGAFFVRRPKLRICR